MKNFTFWNYDQTSKGSSSQVFFNNLGSENLEATGKNHLLWSTFQVSRPHVGGLYKNPAHCWYLLVISPNFSSYYFWGLLPDVAPEVKTNATVKNCSVMGFSLLRKCFRVTWNGVCFIEKLQIKGMWLKMKFWNYDSSKVWKFICIAVLR